MPSRKEQQEALERARKFIDECRDHHDEFIRGVDRRAEAYLGVVELQKEAAETWHSRLYPKYAMHIVDSTLASMVEDRLRGKVKPRLTIDSMLDPQAAEKSRLGAEAHQILLDWQIRQTKFTRIQRPFLLQNAIAKLTVAKTYWVEKNQRRRRMVTEMRPLEDEYGDQIFNPMTGEPLTYPHLVEKEQVVTVYDGPDTEVVDVHDFFWAKNARNAESSRYLAHRVWISREELERGFREGGPYGPQRGGWSWNKVQKTLGETRSMKDTSGSPRWAEKGESTHDHDLLPVFEVWDQFLKEVTVYLGTALLAHGPFPFFHESTPFTVCTTQPGLFSFEGISQIEKVEALQEMLWAISNQRIDNLRLINNAIVIFRPDLEDADALEFAPQAMWPMEDPEQVQMWTPNPIPAEISLGAEALIKGDMQNLASTFPFSSGAESQTVDQKTATGASIVSALAQRSIDMSKQPVYDAWEDILEQRMILNNQFIREPTAATVLGLEGEEIPHLIMPELLEGDFEYVQEAIPDAVIQQQEQAKSLAVFQTIMNSAQLILPLASEGLASMINVDALVEYVLKAHGVEDTKQFFIAKTPAPQAVPPQGGGGGAGAPPGEQPLGITGEGSIDPAVSPGAQISSSPATNLQRAQALSSGRNA